MLIYEAFKSWLCQKNKVAMLKGVFFKALKRSNESDLAGAACPATLSFFLGGIRPPLKVSYGLFLSQPPDFPK
jgi:hypothetical protein